MFEATTSCLTCVLETIAPARLLGKCTAFSFSLVPTNHALGTRFASYSKPQNPSRQPSSARVAPAKPGLGPTLKLEPKHGVAGTKPDSKQQVRRVDPTKLRDENITYKRVHLADPETGALGPPTPLVDIIAAARRMEPSRPEENAEAGGDKKVKWWKQRRYCVELVAERPQPIVKIIDLVDSYHKKREAAKKKKDSVVREKEIQMTWSVAQGDFEHKMRKAREALADGERVTIGFARKKGQQFPKPVEMTARLDETAQSLADVAEEWKPKVVLPNHTAFLYLRNKV